MKRFLAILLFAAGLISCTPQVNYKTERDKVIKFHDVVMEDHSTLVNNGMKLDSLLKNLPSLKNKFPDLDTLKEKVAMNAILTRLNNAEDLMNDWMHKFEPDITGKSNEEAVRYFKAERIKIGRIDSLYKAEIKLSGTYLAQFRK